VLGELAPVRVVIVRTDALVIVADHFVCYPSGFELGLAVRVRPAVDGSSRSGRFFMGPIGWPPSGEAADNRLRFGIAYADGRTATNYGGLPDLGSLGEGGAASASGSATVIETRPGGGAPAEPSPPLLLPRGGTGGGTRWDQDYWVWGLPPAGPLGLVVEWPSEDIPETRANVDGATIVQAAARAEVLWDV